MELNLKSRVVRSASLAAAPVEDELVMADIDAGKYYGLNNIAASIWDAIEEEISIEEVCSKLCDEYDVDPELCRTEVIGFVEKMLSKGMVLLVE